MSTVLSFTDFNQMAVSGVRLPAAGRTPGAVSRTRVRQCMAARTRGLDARRCFTRAPHRLYAHSF